MREARGGAWRRPGILGDEREKQEVAGDVAAGERARDTHIASRREEEDRGGGGLGCCWAGHSAGPAEAPGLQVRTSGFFSFCSLFYFSDIFLI